LFAFLLIFTWGILQICTYSIFYIIILSDLNLRLMKTKRNYIFLAFIFCGILSASAQQSKFSLGAKAGVAIPSLTSGSNSTPLSEGYASRFGFYGGVVSEMKTGKHFGFRAELNFSSQGGMREGMQALPLDPSLEPLWQMLPAFGITPDEYMYADIKSEAILNYLEIPVMAKYRIGLSSKIDFYAQAGPYVGILLNAKNITSGSSSIYVDPEGTIPVDAILVQAGQEPIGVQSFDHTQDITSDLNRFNFGAQAALGFGLKIKSGEIFIEGGGNYGFLNIQKDAANGSNNTGAGTVTLGYLFNL
jgi:hypothetical protein